MSTVSVSNTLFYLVWEVTVAATILAYLTQYMNYVPLQTKHELFKSLHMYVCEK